MSSFSIQITNDDDKKKNMTEEGNNSISLLSKTQVRYMKGVFKQYHFAIPFRITNRIIK